jgi:hypothetical protein
MKMVLIALIVGAFAASPAAAALYNWTIVGANGFSGSGTFTASDTLDPDAEEPGGFLVTAMTGTFKGSVIAPRSDQYSVRGRRFLPVGRRLVRPSC